MVSDLSCDGVSSKKSSFFNCYNDFYSSNVENVENLHAPQDWSTWGPKFRSELKLKSAYWHVLCWFWCGFEKPVY